MLSGTLYNKYLTGILLIIATIVSSFTYAETFADVEVSILNDDNLTRTGYDIHKKSGTSINLFADYGKYYDLNNNRSSTASIFIQSSTNIDYDQLSSIGFGISGSMKKKLGLGAYSSAINISASLASNSVKDKTRSNIEMSVNASWSKRLNDTWELESGFSIDHTDAQNIVFDSLGATLFIVTDYTLSDNLLANFVLSHRKGNIVSIYRDTSGHAVHNASSVHTDDLVFNDGLKSYRVDAETSIIKASLSYALNNDSSINTSYEYQVSKILGAGDTKYINKLLNINYIYSF